MNKEQALTKLAALEAETKALRQIIEAPEAPEVPVVPKRWRPRSGDSYSLVLANGAVRDFTIDLTDKEYEHGNCFKTAAQAEIAAKAVSQTLRMCAAAFAVDPDAGEYCNGRRWSAYREGGKWCKGLYTHTDRDRPADRDRPIYVNSYKQAVQMAAILNAEGV